VSESSILIYSQLIRTGPKRQLGKLTHTHWMKDKCIDIHSYLALKRLPGPLTASPYTGKLSGSLQSRRALGPD